MLNEFLFTKIKEKDIGNICFQQVAEATLDVLRHVCEDRIICFRLAISEPGFETVGLLFVK